MQIRNIISNRIVGKQGGGDGGGGGGAAIYIYIYLNQDEDSSRQLNKSIQK